MSDRSPIRIAVVTMSDKGAAGERADESGDVLVEILCRVGTIERRDILPDNEELIREKLIHLADAGFDLVVTTGGTGLSPRDVTPEATLSVIDREIPGMAEAMRSASVLKTPHGMLSRAVAGARGKTMIINLPGSPRAARENLEVVLPVLPHAVAKLKGDPSDCARP